MPSDDWPVAGRVRLGTVSAFDEARGLGTVADDAGLTFCFHCIAIADGTRTIEVGQSVFFVLRAGRGGRLEAAQLEKR